MNGTELKSLRDSLARAMESGEAHVTLDKAIQDFPVRQRGLRPPGLPHTAWELLEHMRLAQWDILEFSRSAKHVSPPWPDGYWPKEPQPPSREAWDQCVAVIRRDRRSMQRLVQAESTDLFAPIPWGSGQTILREALLIADHNAYHIGQLVLVRRALGNWK